jgi:type I restriction enzyme R subunit
VERLLNQAVASTEVVDILEAFGFDRPDISVLSEAFLLEVAGMEHENLAVEALKELLNGEIQGAPGPTWCCTRRFPSVS